MPKKSARKSVSSKNKAVARKAKLSKTKRKVIGLSTRLKGHVRASTRRNQARRDSK